VSLLAVDVDNSHTVLGVLDDAREVVADWRVATDARRTADEWAVLVRGLLGPHLDQLDGVAVCATVPAVLQEWRAMLARHLPGLRCVVVEPGVGTRLAGRTDNPREVGADRVVNASAALAAYGAPVLVVDVSGTATTFDVVDPAGHFVGGAIAPGLEIALEALGRRGAQLRHVELVRPRTVVARNTVEALQSGAVLGTASLVDGLVARMLDELGLADAVVPVVATGPLAELVVGECRCFTEHAPWLTLDGLGQVFDRNT
jgi:type III pantothenate kinase